MFDSFKWIFKQVASLENIAVCGLILFSNEPVANVADHDVCTTNSEKTGT